MSMVTQWAIIAALALTAGSVSAANSQTPIGYRIKLPSTQESLVVECARLKYSDSRCWVPNVSDIESLESQIFPFVKGWVSERGRRLKIPIFKYQRQYLGSVWRDKKVIIVRGFYDQPGLPVSNEYLYGPFEVFDAGATFFMAYYDVEADAFVDFGFSGPW